MRVRAVLTPSSPRWPPAAVCGSLRATGRRWRRSSGCRAGRGVRGRSTPRSGWRYRRTAGEGSRRGCVRRRPAMSSPYRRWPPVRVRRRTRRRRRSPAPGPPGFRPDEFVVGDHPVGAPVDAQPGHRSQQVGGRSRAVGIPLDLARHPDVGVGGTVPLRAPRRHPGGMRSGSSAATRAGRRASCDAATRPPPRTTAGSARGHVENGWRGTGLAPSMMPTYRRRSVSSVMVPRRG